MNTDEDRMRLALANAEKAEQAEEVPVGALIIDADSKIIGQGWNQPIGNNDPTSHAEIIALRDAAARLENYRLPATSLYVTLEPCPMCAGAIVHARVGRVVYATADPRTGSAGSVYDLLNSPHLNHRVDVDAGVMQHECSTLLKTFFLERRKKIEK